MPGDVRRGDVHQCGQLGIDIRLVFPHIQHGQQVSLLLEALLERRGIDTATAAGTQQHAAGLHGADALGIDQMMGRMLATGDHRGVHADDITLGDQLIEVHEAGLLGALIALALKRGARRVTDQHLGTQRLETLDQS